MKRVILFILAAAVLAGCNNSGELVSMGFTDTGCARNTTKADGLYGEPTRLILKHVKGGLQVTITNETMNCSITEGGLVNDVTIKDNIINYRVYEKLGCITDCLCPVEKMSSVVSGLQLGKEYTFNYNHRASVTFVYSSSLFLVHEIE